MLMPVGMTIMTRAAGPDRVGRVMAVLGVPMLLGPIFGPILGGWLIDVASWHWIFLINVPIGAGALVYAARVLPKDEVAPSETLRLPRHAAALAGAGAVPVRRLLDPWRGHRLGRTSPRLGGDRPGADRALRAPLLRPQARAPADRPAPVPQPAADDRGGRDGAVRDRVLRRQPAVPPVLPADPPRDHAECRPPAGAAGHRRDDHHAGRAACSPTGSVRARSC